jgi:hypothetical protein
MTKDEFIKLPLYEQSSMMLDELEVIRKMISNLRDCLQESPLSLLEGFEALEIDACLFACDELIERTEERFDVEEPAAVNT